MYCIDNLDSIKFFGNFNTDNTQSLRLELYTCDSDLTKKNCKDPKSLVKAKRWPYLLTLTNSQQYEKNNYDSDIITDESLLVWNRLSLVSPFLKSQIVQVNTIIANDSIVKLNDSKTLEYFKVKEVGSGPVDDDLTGAIIVINYEASLDTIID
jgi:hypothetical protein